MHVYNTNNVCIAGDFDRLNNDTKCCGIGIYDSTTDGTCSPIGFGINRNNVVNAMYMVNPDKIYVGGNLISYKTNATTFVSCSHFIVWNG